MPIETTEHLAWTAIVPVRAGSKGLPGKNIKLLNGMPLYMHAVTQALAAGAQRVIISTDIADILDTSHDQRVVLYRRPAELCLDTAPMAPVISDVITSAQIQGPVVLLQATSPLRQAQDITQGLQAYMNAEHKLVMSVTPADKSILKSGFVSGDSYVPLTKAEHCFSNRQALPEVYKPNGAVYVFDAQWFLQNDGFATDQIGVVVMDKLRSLDVDTQADFDACEQILTSTEQA